MRIKKLLPVSVKGFPNFNVGDVADIPPGLAHELLGMRAAILAEEEPKLEAGFIVGREMIQAREPVAETRDPEAEQKPKRGRPSKVAPA